MAGNTFNTGKYVNAIFQDSSNNIGIGAAPSGTYKFEVTGTAKISGITTFGSTLSNGTYAYTLPSATGTIALTSDIPSLTGYVPYTGATTNVDLGTNSITLFNITSNNVLIVKNTGSVTGTNGFSSFSGNIANNGFTFAPNNSSYHRFIVPTSSNYDYTFPAATGTLALTSQIPTNPVGGTGTTNYLPKFTGTSTIGNSLVYDDGTNVGIGTTSPNAKLEVTSRIAATNGGGASRVALNIESNGSGTSYSAINSYNYGTVAGRPLAINESGGNVMINTTTDAGYKLDVNGTGRFAGRISTTGGSANDVFSQYFTIQDITNTNDYVLRFRNNAGSAIGYIGVISSGGVFQYNNSNGHNFTGAATFSSTVQAYSKVFIQRAAGGADTLIQFKNEVGTDKAKILFGGTNEELSFYAGTGATENMRITSGGNVLIGTTTDSGNKLVVNGSIESQTGVFVGSKTVTISALNTSVLLFSFPFSGIITARDNSNGGSGVWLQDPNGGNVAIASNWVNGAYTVFYSGGNTYIQKTSGNVPVSIQYVGLAQ